MADKDTKWDEVRDKRVYGRYQYDMTRNSPNLLTVELLHNLNKEKKAPNVKKQPTCVDPGDYEHCISFIDQSINYCGKTNTKPSFLDGS
jgi:hypothetical protein